MKSMIGQLVISHVCRRWAATEHWMKDVGQDGISMDSMLQVLSTYPTQNELTMYSTVSGQSVYLEGELWHAM